MGILNNFDQNQHHQLIHSLVAKGTLKNPYVIEAFKQVDRALFVRDQDKHIAYQDRALPIGHGQTISQPYTVAFMLEELDPSPGQRTLDVGSGSGWTTALLSHIVGANGTVFGVEIVSELVKFGQQNLKKAHITNAKIKQAKDKMGLVEESPFDRILVSASGSEVSQELINQLAKPGILVMPIKNSIIKITKDKDGNLSRSETPGFVFVPLIEQEGRY